MFKLSIPSLVLRFYLMMVVGIIAVYANQSALLIFLTFAIAVSAILGYRIGQPAAKATGKVVKLEESAQEKKQKAV